MIKQKQKKVKQAVKLYKEGKSLTNIAQKFKVSHTTIRRWLIASGIALRKQQCQWTIDGLTLTEASEKYDLPYNVLYQRLKAGMSYEKVIMPTESQIKESLEVLKKCAKGGCEDSYDLRWATWVLERTPDIKIERNEDTMPF